MKPEEEDILERPIPIDEDQAERVRLRIRRKLPGRRLDKYLHARFPRLSRTAIQRLIKQGAITVNGQPTKSSYEMCGGDVVELVIPPPEPREVVPENIPLDIIYEDEHILAINKRTGIICHPARGDQTGTIANALVYYANQLSHGEDPFRPGIVHRLDKNTTGVMLVAKTDEAHWRLSLQFERRTVQKTYLAIVHGCPHLDGDTIDAPIGVHPVVREKFAVMVRENKIDVAKHAVTHYEVAERYKATPRAALSEDRPDAPVARAHVAHRPPDRRRHDVRRARHQRIRPHRHGLRRAALRAPGAARLAHRVPASHSRTPHGNRGPVPTPVQDAGEPVAESE